MTNFQDLNFDFWDLDFGIYLEFGFWNLEFPLLCSGGAA